MNDLALHQWINSNQIPRILVSGDDQRVRQRVLWTIFGRLFQEDRTLIVCDNTGAGVDLAGLGFSVYDGLCGRFRHYDPFQCVDGGWKELSRLRQILSVLGLPVGDKLPVYFQLLQEMETARTGVRGPLTLETFRSYQAAFLFEEKLDALPLPERKRKLLRSIYYEVCQPAAEFGNAMLLLAPLITGEETLPSRNHSAILYRVGQMRGDPCLQRLVGQVLRFALEDRQEPAAVVILDDGCGDTALAAELIACLPQDMELYYVTKDAFSAEEMVVRRLESLFETSIFSRHRSMESCRAIERMLGTIPVRHSTYTVHYDRRWKANSPWDIFLGSNKSEDYGEAAPVEEPRYRKEEIAAFPGGTAILTCRGRSMIATI